MAAIVVFMAPCINCDSVFYGPIFAWFLSTFPFMVYHGSNKYEEVLADLCLRHMDVKYRLAVDPHCDSTWQEMYSGIQT